MKIHVVQEPFFSRVGQFKEGKKSLCVGIAKEALRNYEQMRIYVGDNRRVYYDITYKKAQQLWIDYKKDMFCKSKGKMILIIPIDDFTIGVDESISVTKEGKESEVTSLQDSLFDHEKEK